MKIGVITAMDKEYALVSGLIERGADMVVRASGIGKVNAALAAWRLIKEDGVDAVINTGCAGGVDPSVAICDVVVGSGCAYHDVWCGEPNARGQVQGLPLVFEADPSMLDKVRKALTGVPGVHEGLIISGDQFLTSAEDDARLKSIHPAALACDMEAAAIAQVCHMAGVPFVSFKVVSDVHYDTDKSVQLYEGFWNSLADKSFETLSAIFKAL